MKIHVCVYAQDVWFCLEQAYQDVHTRLNLAQRRQKALYDRAAHGSPYALGDLVWLHCPGEVGKAPSLLAGPVQGPQLAGQSSS